MNHSCLMKTSFTYCPPKWTWKKIIPGFLIYWLVLTLNMRKINILAPSTSHHHHYLHRPKSNDILDGIAFICRLYVAHLQDQKIWNMCDSVRSYVPIQWCYTTDFLFARPTGYLQNKPMNQQSCGYQHESTCWEDEKSLWFPRRLLLLSSTYPVLVLIFFHFLTLPLEGSWVLFSKIHFSKGKWVS